MWLRTRQPSQAAWYTAIFFTAMNFACALGRLSHHLAGVVRVKCVPKCKYYTDILLHLAASFLALERLVANHAGIAPRPGGSIPMNISGRDTGHPTIISLPSAADPEPLILSRVELLSAVIANNMNGNPGNADSSHCEFKAPGQGPWPYTIFTMNIAKTVSYDSVGGHKFSRNSTNVSSTGVLGDVGRAPFPSKC